MVFLPCRTSYPPRVNLQGSDPNQLPHVPTPLIGPFEGGIKGRGFSGEYSLLGQGSSRRLLGQVGLCPCGWANQGAHQGQDRARGLLEADSPETCTCNPEMRTLRLLIKTMVWPAKLNSSGWVNVDACRDQKNGRWERARLGGQKNLH